MYKLDLFIIHRVRKKEATVFSA